MYNVLHPPFPRGSPSTCAQFEAKVSYSNWKNLNPNECSLLQEFHNYLLSITRLFYLDKAVQISSHSDEQN